MTSAASALSTTLLAALADGRALPASALAGAVRGDADQVRTTLATLLTQGRVELVPGNGHRYYRLPEVQLASSGARPEVRTDDVSQLAPLQRARRCYGHLAGRLGVLVAQRLLARGYTVVPDRDHVALTAAGAAWCQHLGLPAGATHRALKPCLDWTERVPHLGGTLAVSLFRALCENAWLEPVAASRAVALTPTGRDALARELALPAARLDAFVRS